MSFGATRRSGYDPVGLVRPESRNAVIDGNGNGFSSPLPPTSTTTTYPPTQLQDRGASMSQSSIPPASGSGRRVHMNDSIDLNKPRLDSYDAERNQYGPRMPEPSRPGLTSSSRNSSWDLLNGIRKIETGYEEFDSRNASSRHLVFADGDVPQNKLSKFYHYLLNVSIVSRWILFIIPILAILWIPGILQLTDTTPNGNVWGVPFMWWSIWLSVVWGGWWASLAGSLLIPPIIRATLGAVAVGARRYIDWAGVLHRYVAFFGWSLAVWVSFNPLIDKRQNSDASEGSVKAINILGRLLFGVYLCSAVLLGEKFAIQFIAGKFHERSYAERIADQKFAVRSLVTLYRNSSDIPGRSDTLKASHAKAGSVNPKRFFKRALKGVRSVATTTTTAFGNVASEIAGSSVLQPNSPQAMVKTALESANKSRLLARRLFYSFVRPGSEYIFVEDIARFFPSAEEADQVFALFDHDTNGDASRDEVEMACMEFHREQLSIEHSMQDLDSAVGRLDNIFMSVYFIAALLIIAICLAGEAGLSTVVTGAGTFVLGLSWLIGSTLADVLTSIIFLFIRHPFDVGDRVDVDKVQYTVKEIRLLSTIFINSEGVFVQVPNSVLNGHFIHNIRRSGQMSEEFKFDVAYETSFDDLERLRHRMLDFVQTERRDYQPSFDVQVLDFPEQEKITLTAEIKYKSNGQMDGLKAKRRNKWVCALKTAMAEVPIYGPKGGPDAPAGPTRYTKVPWDEVKAEERAQQHERVSLARPVPVGGWNLADSNAAIIGGGDVFGEADELNMTSPRRTPSEHHPSAAGTFQMPDASTMPTPAQAPPMPTHSRANEYEMTPRQ